MARTRVPAILPEGTRFVVEGHQAPDGKTVVVARYLVFPDGRRVNLPVAIAPRRPSRTTAERRTLVSRSRSLKSARSRPFLLH